MSTATTPPSNTAADIEPIAGREHEIPAKSRQEMIAEMAYYIAEKRGFSSGYELQDWFQAERIIQEQFPEA